MTAIPAHAIDQEAAPAGRSHLGEGDLLAGDSWHAPLKRDCIVRTIPLQIAVRAAEVHIIKLTETREITPWVNPDKDR